MFDIGWTELLVIAVVLIVVVGPKDLPPMLRAFGKTMTRFRKVAGEFRAQFDEALREADLDEVRQHIADAQRLNPANSLREAMNPLRQMGSEIKADLQRSTVVDHPQLTESQVITPAPQAAVIEAPTEPPAPVIAPPPAAVAEASPLKPKAVRKPRVRPIENAVEEPAVIEPAQVAAAASVEKPKRASRKIAAETVVADTAAAAPKKATARRSSAEKDAVAVLVEPAQVKISEEPAKPKRTPRKVVAVAVEEASAAPVKARTPRKSAKKKDDA